MTVDALRFIEEGMPGGDQPGESAVGRTVTSRGETGEGQIGVPGGLGKVRMDLNPARMAGLASGARALGAMALEAVPILPPGIVRTGLNR